MAKYTWTTDEILTKALLDRLLIDSANGESADDLTKLAVKDQSGAGAQALELLCSENLSADRILTLSVNDAAREIHLHGNIDLAGNLTTAGAVTFAGAFAIIQRASAGTDITLPTTGTLVTLDGNETLTTKTLTAPDINGGTADALTSLGIRSTGAAFDLKLATAVAFSATRTLSITIPDSATALTLTGDLIRIGAHSLTLRTSAATDITLPTTGTLITNAVTTLASLVSVGTIATGTWQATAVDVPYGGTGVATLTDHGVLFGSGASAITPLGAGTALQILQSGGAAADPAWSTATYPATTTINRILYSSAANVVDQIATANSGVLVTGGTGVPSIATDIPTAVTLGTKYIYRAEGTDVPLADGGTNASLVAAVGAIPYSSATAIALLAAAAGAGPLLRSGGAAAPTWTTTTFPATIGINEIFYASAANVLGVIAAVNSGVLVTGGTGVPSIATDIPTAVTIGGAAIYRAAGTDVAVADGGTNISAYTVGDLLVATVATTLAPLIDVAVGQVLCSGGVGVIPAWSATPTFTSSVQTGRGEVGRVNLKDDTTLTIATGVITATQSYHAVDTEGAAAADDLTDIEGGAEGDILIIFPVNAARTVVAKHTGAGANKLNLAGGADFTMDEDDDFLMLLFDGTLWQQVGRSENHA